VSYDDGRSRIGSDPFSTPAAAREPVRRLRGRLASPVTVWTAYGPGDVPVGLTVSSIVVAEGEPPEVLGLIDPLSVLWDALQDSRRFLVHVLAADHERTAERFALRFPGDPFEEEAPRRTPWGPALSRGSTRFGCTLVESTEAGYARLVRAGIEEITLDERPVRPLVYYRGTYLTAEPGRE
jgi:3-hydroxy-9,10-secoandrosta-1,3,5(10)-triene-9,17-dione monooxygenase reductase component